MAETSKIEWTDATWNPVTGCSVVSPGCTNCYAMRMAGTRLKGHPSRAGLTVASKAGPVWNGQVRLNEGWLGEPLRWRGRKMIFVCAHGDLFHESVPDAWIDRVFAVMALCPQHTFQVLTKRSARMRAYLSDKVRSVPPGLYRANNDRRSAIYHWLAGNASQPQFNGGLDAAPADVAARMDALFKGGWPLANVWLGTSVEDQARADERIPDLLATPAAMRFVSAEPLLGRLKLDHYLIGWEDHGGTGQCVGWRPPLDWVIVGGESGPNARPMHPDWARSLRDQCVAAGVPFFFKQWGEWAPDTGPFADGDPIMDGRARCAVWGDGNWTFYNSGFEPPVGPRDALEWVYRLGKARAAALLDGREWREMPGHG